MSIAKQRKNHNTLLDPWEKTILCKIYITSNFQSAYAFIDGNIEIFITNNMSKNK